MPSAAAATAVREKKNRFDFLSLMRKDAKSLTFLFYCWFQKDSFSPFFGFLFLKIEKAVPVTGLYICRRVCSCFFVFEEAYTTIHTYRTYTRGFLLLFL